MENTFQKKYIKQDILRKKKRSHYEIENKAQQMIKRRISKKYQHLKEKEVRNPEEFIRKNRTKTRSYQVLKRRTKRLEKGVQLVEGKKNQKLLLVLRIRGIENLSNEVKKVFTVLNLPSVMSLSLLKNNEATIKQIKKVESYVTYGLADHKTLSDLIYKKGYAKVNGERKPLTSNILIEESLGSLGILCLEDLMHDLMNTSDNFEKVVKFIWPFKLTNIEELKENLKKPFQKGGQWGERGQKINELIQKLI